MKGFSLPGVKTLKPPAIKAPRIPMPKPIKAPAPRIAGISISKIGGGFKVEHQMTHGPKIHPFVYQDPAKMMQHLARVQKSQWREPDRNYGTALDKTLNLEPGSM